MDKELAQKLKMSPIMISMIILNFKSIIKGLLKKQVITTLNG